MDDLITILKDLKTRVEALERRASLSKVTIPSDGFLVVDSQSSDPTGTNGRIYYNTTSNKFKVYEGGAWKTITTS